MGMGFVDQVHRVTDEIFWFRTDRTIAVSILIALIAVIGTLGLTLWVYASLPLVVPFWYSIPWGEARLAPRIFLIYLLGGALLLILGNLLVAKIARSIPTATHLLALTSALVAILASITVLQIIRLWLP